jgi:hypothetical protein
MPCVRLQALGREVRTPVGWTEDCGKDALVCWSRAVPICMRLRPVTLREANDFVENFHRHNGRTARNGGKWAVGIEAAGELVGVAIVGNPLSATFMDGWTAEVLRVCVNDKAEKGGCSMLYSACWRAWRAMGGERLVTYTLTTESGASLRGAGWRIVGQTKPVADGWRKNDHLNARREWQPVMGQTKLRWETTRMTPSDKTEPQKPVDACETCKYPLYGTPRENFDHKEICKEVHAR